MILARKASYLFGHSGIDKGVEAGLAGNQGVGDNACAEHSDCQKQTCMNDVAKALALSGLRLP